MARSAWLRTAPVAASMDHTAACWSLARKSCRSRGPARVAQDGQSGAGLLLLGQRASSSCDRRDAAAGRCECACAAAGQGSGAGAAGAGGGAAAGERAERGGGRRGGGGAGPPAPPALWAARAAAPACQAGASQRCVHCKLFAGEDGAASSPSELLQTCQICMNICSVATPVPDTTFDVCVRCGIFSFLSVCSGYHARAWVCSVWSSCRGLVALCTHFEVLTSKACAAAGGAARAGARPAAGRRPAHGRGRERAGSGARAAGGRALCAARLCGCGAVAGHRLAAAGHAVHVLGHRRAQQGQPAHALRCIGRGRAGVLRARH